MSPLARVGVLGLSHDHVWPNLRALAAGERGRLVAAADPDPELRARLAGEHPGAELHETYDDLLERTDLDAVFVYADNRTSAELARRAVERDLPTMLEKPMAADLAGAEALLAAARAGGVPLMVNWPTAWRPAIRHAVDLVRAGIVGEPIQVSYRGGHVGPREYGCSDQFCDWLYDPHRNGGGALVDYCGYGALICHALLGRPTGVTAVAAHLRKPDLVAEDNAVIVLHYGRTLALLEGTWTEAAPGSPYPLVVYGDLGTLLVHQPKAAREGGPVEVGRVEIVTRDGSRPVAPPPLPSDERDGPTFFLSRLGAGRPIDGLCNPDLARDVQETLAAALHSAAAGRQIPLPLARPQHLDSRPTGPTGG